MRRMRSASRTALAALLFAGLLVGCSVGSGTTGTKPATLATESAPPLPSIGATEAIAGLRIARIDGRSSGRSWLRVEGESILATGLIGTGASVQRAPAGYEAVVELMVPERVGSVTLYHVVPLFLPHDAKVTLDGRSLDASRMADFRNPDPDLSLSGDSATAVFKLDGDRPTAISLAAKSSESDLPEDAPQASPANGFVHAAQLDSSVPWISARRGETTTLPAYYAGGHGEAGTDVPTTNWEDYFVADRLGSATVFHAISVSTKPTSAQQAKPGTDVELRITLEGSRFVSAE